MSELISCRLQCSAHIVLAGLVDPAKEVSRLEKKMAALVGTADKLEKAAKVSDSWGKRFNFEKFT